MRDINAQRTHRFGKRSQALSWFEEQMVWETKTWGFIWPGLYICCCGNLSRTIGFLIQSQAELGVDLRKLVVLLPMWISFVLGTIFGARLKNRQWPGYFCGLVPPAGDFHDSCNFFFFFPMSPLPWVGRCFCWALLGQVCNVHPSFGDLIPWIGLHDVKVSCFSGRRDVHPRCFYDFHVVFYFKAKRNALRLYCFVLLVQASFEGSLSEVWQTVLAGEIARSLDPKSNLFRSPCLIWCRSKQCAFVVTKMQLSRCMLPTNVQHQGALLVDYCEHWWFMTYYCMI